MSKVNYNPQPGKGTVSFDYFLVADPNSPAPSPSSTGTNQKDVPVGAIVGAVVGGLFFFLASGFFLLFYRRRARIQIVGEKFEAYSLVPFQHEHMSIEAFIPTAEDSLSNSPSLTSADNSQSSSGGLATMPPHISLSRKSVIREYGSRQPMRVTNIVDNTDSPAIESQLSHPGADLQPVPGPSRDTQEPGRVRDSAIEERVELPPVYSPT
ncbi:hypothetical protein H0H81_012406 [Sphagnurus paluster]|uniref:Uncharacterized protein n=1 Tax=Sphagnurus paluster TaxID=117069 RepID=A0A9P7K3N8_9AGAR|nr:hypothetical protein H0H81_012406 [Sphagnurus paluster]